MTYVNDGATTAADDFRVGRLASHLDGFETLLRDQGYAQTTIRQKLDLLADFCAWVERHDVPPDVHGEKLTSRFLREYRRRGAKRGDAWTIRQFDRIFARRRLHIGVAAAKLTRAQRVSWSGHSGIFYARSVVFRLRH